MKIPLPDSIRRKRKINQIGIRTITAEKVGKSFVLKNLLTIITIITQTIRITILTTIQATETTAMVRVEKAIEGKIVGITEGTTIQETTGIGIRDITIMPTQEMMGTIQTKIGLRLKNRTTTKLTTQEKMRI